MIPFDFLFFISQCAPSCFILFFNLNIRLDDVLALLISIRSSVGTSSPSLVASMSSWNALSMCTSARFFFPFSISSFCVLASFIASSMFFVVFSSLSGILVSVRPRSSVIICIFFFMRVPNLRRIDS